MKYFAVREKLEIPAVLLCFSNLIYGDSKTFGFLELLSGKTTLNPGHVFTDCQQMTSHKIQVPDSCVAVCVRPNMYLCFDKKIMEKYAKFFITTDFYPVDSLDYSRWLNGEGSFFQSVIGYGNREDELYWSLFTKSDIINPKLKCFDEELYLPMIKDLIKTLGVPSALNMNRILGIGENSVISLELHKKAGLAFNEYVLWGENNVNEPINLYETNIASYIEDYASSPLLSHLITTEKPFILSRKFFYLPEITQWFIHDKEKLFIQEHLKDKCSNSVDFVLDLIMNVSTKNNLTNEQIKQINNIGKLTPNEELKIAIKEKRGMVNNPRRPRRNLNMDEFVVPLRDEIIRPPDRPLRDETITRAPDRPFTRTTRGLAPDDLTEAFRLENIPDTNNDENLF